MTKAKKEEQNNEDDLTQEEENKIAKLTLGNDYSAEITIKDKYIFHVCAPTFFQDLQIGINTNNMLVDMIKEDKEIKWLSTIICTVRMIVIKIEELKKENGTERKVLIDSGPDCFWRFIENRHDVEHVYQGIMIPLYLKYLEFKHTLDTDIEELKNS